jgi:hypothetical protein
VESNTPYGLMWVWNNGVKARRSSRLIRSHRPCRSSVRSTRIVLMQLFRYWARSFTGRAEFDSRGDLTESWIPFSKPSIEPVEPVSLFVFE